MTFLSSIEFVGNADIRIFLVFILQENYILA